MKDMQSDFAITGLIKKLLVFCIQYGLCHYNVTDIQVKQIFQNFKINLIKHFLMNKGSSKRKQLNPLYLPSPVNLIDTTKSNKHPVSKLGKIKTRLSYVRSLFITAFKARIL